MRIRSLDYEERLKALGEGFGTSTGNSLSISFSWKKFSIMSNRFILRSDDNITPDFFLLLNFLRGITMNWFFKMKNFLFEINYTRAI